MMRAWFAPGTMIPALHFPLPGAVLARRSSLVLTALVVLCWPWTASAAEQGVFSDALARGPLFVALAAFGFGLLVSLTPCVYPMVAITVSVFGAREATSRVQSFALSGAFVLGLVTMFTPLGVSAALTGKTFGAALSSPWVVALLSGVLLLLALSMFGAFDLDIPTALKNRLAGAGGNGYLGAFVLGLVCGPISAPCTGPFLGGLLTWIAQTQSVGLGTATMVAFALGLGMPFFLVGAFAMQLPKSGRWMVHIKSLMGIILVVVALYFLGNAFAPLRTWIRPGVGFLAASVAAVLVGLALGAVHRSFEAAGWGERMLKGVGVVFVCLGSFAAIHNATTPERTLTWEPQREDQDVWSLVVEARERAVAEGKPVFMDFTAAWCAACKEIEKRTFPDERVQLAAGRFVALKLDMTDDSDPAVEKTFREFTVRGLPTLILFDSSGREVHRFNDFVDAAELATAMEAVN